MKKGHLILIYFLLNSLVGCESFDAKILEKYPIPAFPSPKPTLADANTLGNIERKVYQQVNQYRQTLNLPLLTLNQEITQQARLHSQRMAAQLVPFSHDGFEGRIETIGIVLPYQSAAENIAVNQGFFDPAMVAVEGWLKSKGHRQNMQGNFDLTGIGVAQDSKGKFFLTQIFLKKASSVSFNIPSKILSKKPTLNLTTLAQETHQRVNQYRLSQGLPPLQLDARVSQEARKFSQKMANKQASFSHDGFDGRAKSVQQFLSYWKFGENLAYVKGYPDPVTISVQGWIKSPGHRKNMEGDYNVTGIGIAKNKEGEYYFTQLFVKKR